MSYQDIQQALENLAAETLNEDLSKACESIKISLQSSKIKVSQVIEILSEYVLAYQDVHLFRKYFSNYLLALVSSKIQLKSLSLESNKNVSEAVLHLDYSIILSLLCDHPDILQYALKYFNVNQTPPYEVYFNLKDSYEVAAKKRRTCRQQITDYDIVLCCYTLLTRLPNELSTKWDWTSFITYFISLDNDDIKWMVKECIAILYNMTEKQAKILSKNYNVSEKDYAVQKINEKTSDLQNIIVSSEDIKLGDVVNIDGVMLPIYDKANVKADSLVPVKSTINNLRSLALSVASGKALSLLGPVGSGKTSLVEHLAAITGRKGKAFKKVQLGDQTDSRMLLGSHQCTDVPGEFVWQPGVLTEAAQKGHWLLLEDIDCAALDVASTLSSLLERNTLCVPGYRDALPVTPGFQLFVTQRTVVTNYGFQKKLSNSSTLLQKHLTQINVEPLSRSELTEIVQTLYPSLSTISSKMLDVYMMFSVGSHESSIQNTDKDKETSATVVRGSRLISTRDLLKWCKRAVVGFDVSSPESALRVLQDALDIFTCSVASTEERLQLSKKVGTYLGIVETKSEFYCKHYKPNVSLKPNDLEVGRAKVPRKEKGLDSIDFHSKQVVYSFTRQSACLLERISCCVTSNEPVLLVGETGTGKTSSVQYLARQTGHRLIVINMNQQSDSADLLGGYKPVDLKYVIRPIRNEFEELFRSYFNTDKNSKFLGHIESCYDSENWNALVILMKQCHQAAVRRLTREKKGTKLEMWLAFGYKLSKLDQQVKAASKLTFAFIEGSLVKAMQEGHWVLLDEINLASAEILECLAGLLEDKNETVELLEKGDKVPIKRHPDFTLFACMNPATDVGKKDLPVGLRNRFTEFFIDELTERNDLILLIGDYLRHMNLEGAILDSIYSFYTAVKKEAKLSLVDGAGNAPHYSLRTLCRALMAAAKAKCGTVTRSLYEAFCMAFLTQLDSSSHPKVEAMVAKAVIGKKNIKSVLNHAIPEPQIPGQTNLLFEGHWIPQGKLDIVIPNDYILTSTVRKNLRDISRIISIGRLPVLLQGDTSVGKTSLITYIAKASGNYCVRINNHEHTDLQEYVGSYAADASGKLVFKEGVLVEAMRKGYWIILDELNLAPSDVLEALNRVLDDNRELFIPETQQLVKADSNFMLFATQNPPGLYGGRKVLSRAFRNRFVELHFDEIPRNELEIILHQRCHVPSSYSKKMIAVMAELQVRRRGSAAVQGKDGFITLRDLFRWGQRYKQTSKEMLTEEKFYDWDQHIADEGYLVLAGKVRQPNERAIIEEVIEKHIKRRVIPQNLFTLSEKTSPVTKSILETILNNRLEEFSHIVWTYNMRRLAVLIAKSFNFSEPVLLVGETGCGKTTICQVFATLRNSQLLTVNCHMHTESSDFLGGLRPVRAHKDDERLFEWVDGPLIKAMLSGYIFLADEISLADDSVLERLNSLLEPERQLVLSERGIEDNSDVVIISAETSFHFIGTMNPGGDFGKKELSPALRNRFTEIWCDSVTSREDLLQVLEKSVNKGLSIGNQQDGTSGIGNSILDFTDWLKNSEVTNKFPFSIRDLLSWVNFINVTVTKGLLETAEAYVHGACMTFLDCFGTTLTGHIESEALSALHERAINFLLEQICVNGDDCTEKLKDVLSYKKTKFSAETNLDKFGIKPFYIDIGPNMNITDEERCFTFSAPTTGSNTLRLLRGLQLNKAILLEGNPGVGKTSLVTALAKCSGHKVVRINLSDQTDITDLFGTDLPTEDGSFMFKEGAFLNALQNGDWILLDELNLAPQPVLEGLNACLDHRGEVFIPELGKTFKIKKGTRLFACQNPLKQGGARRGLPVSFLNRFTQVYVDTLTKNDLIHIVEDQYPTLPKDILHKMVEFNCKVSQEVSEKQLWGHKGGPWEMNLRDVQRWCSALIDDNKSGKVLSPGKFVDILYVNRMRTSEDKKKMTKAYDEIFHPKYVRSDSTPQFYIIEDTLFIGDIELERNVDKRFKNRRAIETNLLVLRNQLPVLKSLAQSVKMNWLSIVVGPTAAGKSSVVQVLADLTGNDLQVVPVTSAMDVSDLLGGFEQVDYNRCLENIYERIETVAMQIVRKMWLTQRSQQNKSDELMSQLYKYKSRQIDSVNIPLSNEFERFLEKIEFLENYCNNFLRHTAICDDVNMALQEVLISLQSLKCKVTKSASVNIGGKFEWIDSLLVKTMTEGSWLLLDNVNLTSSAVLDRLNGLLEPNGVLSIPERGEIIDIRPHKNFRIFFTMDPKYGEISRAMRNRGVEIYLLGHDDFNTKFLETMPYMDLEALLSSCGLPNRYHDACIKCHELMADFILGLGKPTVYDLLQAAYLTWQQITRGISYRTAMLNSFSDVYIKPRCGGDFQSNVNTSLAEMKNIMLKALENQLDDENVAMKLRDTSHTLTVKGLCRNSLLEMSKQIAYVALQHRLSPILKAESPNALHSLFSLFTSYQKCPSENFKALYGVIKAGLQSKEECTKILVNSLNEVAYQNVSKNSNQGIEMYERYYPESHQQDLERINSANTKSLLLYNELIKALLVMLPRNTSFTVLDYSKAVSAKSMDDWFEQYPILGKAMKYLEEINEYIINALQVKASINDETVCEILQLLNWRNRFALTCNKDIYKNKKASSLREEVVPLLYMHSRWLQKNLLQKLLQFLPEGHELRAKVTCTIQSILPSGEQGNRDEAKLGKKLRKLYTQPNLYENQSEYDLCLTRSEVYGKITIDYNQPLEKQFYKIDLDLNTVSESTLALDVPEDTVLAKIQENLAKCLENKDMSQQLNWLGAKLLPLNSYILQRVLSVLQGDLFEKLESVSSGQVDNKYESDYDELLKYTVQMGKVNGGLSIAFLNLMEVIQDLNAVNYETLRHKITSLPTRFWEEFYKNMTYSPACYPIPFLLGSPSNSEEASVIPSQTPRLSTSLPLLLHYIQKLTIAEENDGNRHLLSYENVPLGDRTQYSTHLGVIINMLWKNMATLDSAAHLETESKAALAMKKYIQVMRYLSIAKGQEFPDDSKNFIYFNDCLQAHFYDQGDDFVNIMKTANQIYGKLFNEMFKEKKDSNNSLYQHIEIKVSTAKLSLLTNLLVIKALTEVNPVDHVEKHRLKVKYIEDDIKMFDALLGAYYMHGLVSGTLKSSVNIENAASVSLDAFNRDNEDGENLKKVHPYCNILLELRQKTAESVWKYASGNTFRPERPSYKDFLKECKHFTQSVLSSEATKGLSRKLITTCDTLFGYLKKEVYSLPELKEEIKSGRVVIKEATSWLYSVNAFYKKITSVYSEAFPDISKPLQRSLSELVYNVTNLCVLIKELIMKMEQGPLLSEIVEDLMVFPNSIPNSHSKEKYLSRFTKAASRLFNNRAMCDDDAGVRDDIVEIFKMKSSELKMYCLAMGRIDETVFESMMKSLKDFARFWDDQKKRNERIQQENEALYVTQSKCEDLDEEAEASEEILEMFPSFTENDFGEFKPPSLEQKSSKAEVKNKRKLLETVTPSDVTFMYKLHSDLLRNLTMAEWLRGQKNVLSNNVVDPFVQRYTIFSRIIKDAWEALDANIEGLTSPGLLVLLSEMKKRIDGNDVNSQEVDFYHSAWVSETKQCVPLLHQVRDNTVALLEQWPDFPTLKDIVVIVNRILNFPLTSPVSRFLIGLELLRDKIEEWNKNAHKGNHMIDVSLAVGQQIINWRKLEMSHWKECLNSVYTRKKSEAHKFWFLLHSVSEEYLDESKEEQIKAEQIVTTLKNFMETSTLAEFAVRLDIIYVYHLHLIYLPTGMRRDELLSILWNTFIYYNQFSAQIASLIKDKRAPIEKKLRDFVKICTWDRDLSYWSVKDTVDKAHKTLHKHTKEFENVLKEPVSSYLIDNSTESGTEHVGVWDRPKRVTAANMPAGGAYMIDIQNYLTLARSFKKYLDQIEKPCDIIEESSLLSKATTLLGKAKTLCKDTMVNTSYPSLVQALDDFVAVVIETSSHLGSLEADSTLPKDKQTSQAKNIIQQKRKALADLFKYLAKMGLNHRTGLVILAACETSDELYDFKIPPVDLDAAISYTKNRRCDGSLSLLWSGCERYYQRNIARHRLLSSALLMPHQDLGIQNIERCKGFAAHLLKITNAQKKTISKYSRYLCDLRKYATTLANILEINSSENIALFNETIKELVHCYTHTNLMLEQFMVLLKSVPQEALTLEVEPEFDRILSNSAIVKCYRDSEDWNDLYKKIKSIHSIVNKQMIALNKVVNDSPKEIGKVYDSIPNISQVSNDVVNEATLNLYTIKNEIDNIIYEKYKFNFKFKIENDFESTHPLLNCIVNLSTNLEETFAQLNDLKEPLDHEVNKETSEVNASELTKKSENLIATMLLIIQTMYKKHLPAKFGSSDVMTAIDEIIEDSTKESKEILEDNHLKERLQEKISEDIKLLQLDVLVEKVYNLIRDYVEYIKQENNTDDAKNVVMRVIPILEQTIFFVQYFVTQQVAVHRVSCKMLSVLLKIFSDLAAKGFCRPSDLDTDEAEGEGGSGKFSSGTGLGDGEGQQDVSERIENQDQLDDAHRPGEEKKEEDKDCKEEEKGVNVTDDFDSHLQDVEKKDGDDEQDDDDNEDADKQMGDTDNAAEKLDQQIWGSEEDESEEGDQKEKEDKGTGESTGEKEMAAKEEEEQGKDDGAEGNEKKKKKDINEVDEPEVDDDHIDPYHGKQQQFPEPEDFELPENMDIDENDDLNDEDDGETETENPFEIDVMKDIPEDKDDTPQEEDDSNKNTKDGLDVSSDSEDGYDGKDEEGTEQVNEPKPDEADENKTDQMEEDKDESTEKTEELTNEPEQSEQTPETKENEELPKNPDNINEEEETFEKQQEANPQANPSNDDPSAGEKAEKAEIDKGTGDNVQTNAELAKDDESAPYEQSQEQVGEDKQSMGRSELDKSDRGHRGDRQNAADAASEREDTGDNKPGRTDQERTLGEVDERKQKKSRTLNVEKEEETAEDGGAADEDTPREADLYQHVKQARKDDLQAIDAATKEQAEQQPTLQKEDEKDADELKEDEEVAMDVDEDEIQVEKSEELKPEKMKEKGKEKDTSNNKNEGGEETTGEMGVEVEGEKVLTTNVARPSETTYHTKLDSTKMEMNERDMSVEEYLSLRGEMSERGASAGVGGEAWRALWQASSGAARALCETLRLVLEPTGRSRRAGDFRSGRAINMRRVIPYIASHFRKDRIWLRRSKPAKREYHIAIAVDDSSSMADCGGRQLAFDSLALVSQALNLLESGDLAVLSFGEKTKLLHPFTEQFTEHSGAKILEQLRFEQTKTKIAQLLDFCTVMFEEITVRSDAVNAKLLVIVSDGRGIFSEGEARVVQAVRRARQLGIFLVYVIIDNPENKDSIMDIRRPIMDPVSNTCSFISYLDTFPFPFYLILRDISALPAVLGDALRQWFELAANTSA